MQVTVLSPASKITVEPAGGYAKEVTYEGIEYKGIPVSAGGKIKLLAKLKPAEAKITNTKIKWSVDDSDKKYVKVDQKGNVTILKNKEKKD